jgi:hypothetical protein
MHNYAIIPLLIVICGLCWVGMYIYTCVCNFLVITFLFPQKRDPSKSIHSASLF